MQIRIYGRGEGFQLVPSGPSGRCQISQKCIQPNLLLGFLRPSGMNACLLTRAKILCAGFIRHMRTLWICYLAQKGCMYVLLCMCLPRWRLNFRPIKRGVKWWRACGWEKGVFNTCKPPGPHEKTVRWSLMVGHERAVCCPPKKGPKATSEFFLFLCPDDCGSRRRGGGGFIRQWCAW